MRKDDSYRERIQNRWRGQMLGDTKETYHFYAESVVDVKNAKIIRTPPLHTYFERSPSH